MTKFSFGFSGFCCIFHKYPQSICKLCLNTMELSPNPHDEPNRWLQRGHSPPHRKLNLTYVMHHGVSFAENFRLAVVRPLVRSKATDCWTGIDCQRYAPHACHKACPYHRNHFRFHSYANSIASRHSDGHLPMEYQEDSASIFRVT